VRDSLHLQSRSLTVHPLGHSPLTLSQCPRSQCSLKSNASQSLFSQSHALSVSSQSHALRSALLVSSHSHAPSVSLSESESVSLSVSHFHCTTSAVIKLIMIVIASPREPTIMSVASDLGCN